jgi:hypothetical protein
MNAHAYEAAFWGNCCNTFDEEQKQFVYARKMSMVPDHFRFDLGGKRVADIGGGPTSLLLKCTRFGPSSLVIDPGEWPSWVACRYRAHNIGYLRLRGEDNDFVGFDEAWIYNVLQHVDDPERVVHRARKCAKVLRIFEWTDVEPYPGHPHKLTAPALSAWCGGRGTVEAMDEGGCVGTAFYGVFS